MELWNKWGVMLTIIQIHITVLRASRKTDLLPVLYYYSQNSADFHKVKSLHYDKWLHEELIPNLQSNLVTVSDQAPFHKVHIEKEP